MLGKTGFVEDLFEGTSAAHPSRTADPGAPSQRALGVSVDNLGVKAGNARRSLEDGQIRRVRGIFRAV